MIKKVLLLSLLLSFMYADSYPFLNYNESFNTALNRANKANKLIMLFEVQDNCGWGNIDIQVDAN